MTNLGHSGRLSPIPLVSSTDLPTSMVTVVLVVQRRLALDGRQVERDEANCGCNMSGVVLYDCRGRTGHPFLISPVLESLLKRGSCWW